MRCSNFSRMSLIRQALSLERKKNNVASRADFMQGLMRVLHILSHVLRGAPCWKSFHTMISRDRQRQWNSCNTRTAIREVREHVTSWM